jgi:hypothetical protein
VLELDVPEVLAGGVAGVLAELSLAAGFLLSDPVDSEAAGLLSPDGESAAGAELFDA